MVIAFVLLIMVGIALTFLVRSQQSDHAMVEHTMEVREALNGARLSVADAETGMRGFLITGREDYLVPFENAKGLLPLHLGNIQTLTADNAVQQRTLERLRPIHKMAYSQHPTRAHRQSDRLAHEDSETM